MIAVSFTLFPFDEASRKLNFLANPSEAFNFLSVFKTWDAQYYLFLAESGYGKDPASAAFYPLYPMLIRFFRAFFDGHTLITAFFLSNTFFFAGLAFFYRLTESLYDAAVAFRASVLYLFFPTAFYLHLAYTESLFLMLAFMLFFYLHKDRFWMAALPAFLLPLSKPQGILLIAPLAVFFHVRLFGTKDLDRSSFKPLIPIAALFLGFAAYFAFMERETGSFFSGFDAQKYFIASNSTGNLLDIWGWAVRNFIQIRLTLFDPGTSVFDRIFFFVFLVLAVMGRKMLKPDLLAYILVMGLVPALSGTLTSFPRFTLLIFPIFIVLAQKTGQNYKRWACGMMFFQVFWLLKHCLNYWVA